MDDDEIEQPIELETTRSGKGRTENDVIQICSISEPNPFSPHILVIQAVCPRSTKRLTSLSLHVIIYVTERSQSWLGDVRLR